MKDSFDIAIIGGGILGLATGRALLERHDVSLTVLEAEPELALHQTGRNSGVIHAGLYYKPGSLKASLCTEGREAMYAYCEQRGIRYEQCGKLVVATNEAEIPRLEELHRRGSANGLGGIVRLNEAEVREREPHVRCVAGLFVPQTGIVNFGDVARAIAHDVMKAGGTVRTNARLVKVRRSGAGFELEHSGGVVRCGYLVNCAGLHADRVARLCGVKPQVRIIPFRGEYYELRHDRRGLLRNLVYPVPDPQFPFLGVHFTRMHDGRVEVGPNAVLSLARHGYGRLSFHLGDAVESLAWRGFWRMARKHWRAGAAEQYRSLNMAAFVRAAQALVPEVSRGDLRWSRAGVRAQAVDQSGRLLDDFCFEESENAVHVLNAPSPAATSSLAIGRRIADRVGVEASAVERRSKSDEVLMLGGSEHPVLPEPTEAAHVSLTEVRGE